MLSVTYTYLTTLWRTRSRDLARREAAQTAEFKRHLERQHQRRIMRDRALRRKGYAVGLSPNTHRFVWAGTGFAIGVIVGAALGTQMMPWVERRIAGTPDPTVLRQMNQQNNGTQPASRVTYDPAATRDRPQTFQD